MKSILSLDELTEKCGFFTSETDANNGYGCNHPDQEETEMLYKDGSGYTHRSCSPEKSTFKQGKCYASSCPIASVCMPEDIDELKEIENNIIEEDLEDYDIMITNE